MTINPPDDTPLPLLVHLHELRRRLLWSLLWFFTAFLVSYAVVEHIYNFLLQPLAAAFAHKREARLIYTGLQEFFIVYIKTALFSALMLTLPFLLNQLWRFVAPALYTREKTAFRPFLIASPLLFMLGAALAYYGVIPLAWGFFLGFETTASQTALPVQLEARVSEYLSLSMQILFAFGVCFQLPVLLSLLVRSGLVSITALRRHRRFAIVGAVVLAAVLTPPDVISQVALAVPLILLYELSLLLAGRTSKPHD